MLSRPAVLVALTVLLWLGLSVLGRADTIILKNGSVFKGKIVEETDEKIVMKVPEGKMTFRKEQIEQIERDAKAPPPPVAPPDPEPTVPPETTPPATGGDKAPPPPPPVTGAKVDLSSIPQAPRITLEVQDQPLATVLYELSRQGGHLIQPGHSQQQETAKINVSLRDALFWDAYMAIASQGPWGYEVFSGEGDPIKMEGDDPILAWQVQGPVMFSGRGIVKEGIFIDSKFELRDVLRFDLLMDPTESVRVREPRLDPDFTFTLEDGKQVVLKADSESQAPLSSRRWLFLPRPELVGAKASVALHVDLWGASATDEGELAWSNGSAAIAGEVQFTVEGVLTEKAKKRDEKDWFKEVEVDRFTATCKIIHTAGSLMAKIRKEGRQPTEQENASLAGFPESAVISPFSAWIVGEDGTRLPAVLQGVSGISSPWDGYRFKASVTRAEPGFRPKRIVIFAAKGQRPFSLDFVLKDVPLQAAK